MLSISEHFEKYFQGHDEDLQKNYPGINLNHFLASYLRYRGREASDFYVQDSDFFEQIKNGLPLEYILQEAYFYSSYFFVDQRVLIPRFETEVLVECALRYSKELEPQSICDVGCGSGCIGLSFLKEYGRDIELDLIDLSAEAIEVAKINGQRLSRDINMKKVSFIHSDRLLKSEKKYDLILTNPPYIRKSSLDIHKSVKNNEPEMALFLEDDLFEDWFREFFIMMTKALNKNAMFFMEGSDESLGDLKKILDNLDFSEVEIINDLTGKQRVLKGVFNG